jgi:hypothetical protein
VAGRVLRLGYFTSQPVNLLTALCDNGDRVDLMVVPPRTGQDAADAAMILAATTSNLVHAQHILLTVSAPTPEVAEDAWETEGGRLAGSGRTSSRRQPIR